MNQQKALWLLLWENGVALRKEALERGIDELMQKQHAELAKADPYFQKFMAKVLGRETH
jgi:hypothetical protein